MLSYLPDRYLWQEWAPGYHALNLALFLAVAALLYTLLCRRVPAGTAALACAIVAVHPLCVESVAWISALWLGATAGPVATTDADVLVSITGALEAAGAFMT